MTIECRKCGEPKEVSCTEEQYQNFVNGMLIQNAMPNVPAGERELLISGYCDDCFKKLFREEEDE